MPIDSSAYKAPKEPTRLLLEPNYYVVRLVDIQFQVKPSPFKDKDGNAKPDVQQFKLTLCLPGKEEETFTAWVKDALFVGKNTKNPEATLPKLLSAITGQQWKSEDRAKITPDFLNSLIGSEFRVSTVIESTEQGSQFTKVTGFFPKT